MPPKQAKREEDNSKQNTPLIVAKVFGIFSAICLFGVAYFAFDLFTGAPEVGEIIVLPIYIGFAAIGAFVFGICTLAAWLLRRRKK